MISVYLTRAEEEDLRKLAYAEGVRIGAEIGISTYAHMILSDFIENRKEIIETIDDDEFAIIAKKKLFIKKSNKEDKK